MMLLPVLLLHTPWSSNSWLNIQGIDKYGWIIWVQYSVCVYAWMLSVCENTWLSAHMFTWVHSPCGHAAHAVNRRIYQSSMFWSHAWTQHSVSTATDPAQHTHAQPASRHTCGKVTNSLALFDILSATGLASHNNLIEFFYATAWTFFPHKFKVHAFHWKCHLWF